MSSANSTKPESSAQGSRKSRGDKNRHATNDQLEAVSTIYSELYQAWQARPLKGHHTEEVFTNKFRSRLGELARILTKARLRALPGILLGFLWEFNLSLSNPGRKFDLDAVEVIVDTNHACFHPEAQPGVQTLAHCTIEENGLVTVRKDYVCPLPWWQEGYISNHATPGEVGTLPFNVRPSESPERPVIIARAQELLKGKDRGAGRSQDVALPTLPLPVTPTPAGRSRATAPSLPAPTAKPQTKVPRKTPRMSVTRQLAKVPVPHPRATEDLLPAASATPATSSAQKPLSSAPETQEKARGRRVSLESNGPEPDRQASDKVNNPAPVPSTAKRGRSSSTRRVSKSPRPKKPRRVPPRLATPPPGTPIETPVEDLFDHSLFQPMTPFEDEWITHRRPCLACQKAGRSCYVAPFRTTICERCQISKVKCSLKFPGSMLLAKYRTWVWHQYCENPTRYPDELATMNGVEKAVNHVPFWFINCHNWSAGYEKGAKIRGEGPREPRDVHLRIPYDGLQPEEYSAEPDFQPHSTQSEAPSSPFPSQGASTSVGREGATDAPNTPPPGPSTSRLAVGSNLAGSISARARNTVPSSFPEARSPNVGGLHAISSLPPARSSMSTQEAKGIQRRAQRPSYTVEVVITTTPPGKRRSERPSDNVAGPFNGSARNSATLEASGTDLSSPRRLAISSDQLQENQDFSNQDSAPANVNQSGFLDAAESYEEQPEASPSEALPAAAHHVAGAASEAVEGSEDSAMDAMDDRQVRSADRQPGQRFGAEESHERPASHSLYPAIQRVERMAALTLLATATQPPISTLAAHMVNMAAEEHTLAERVDRLEVHDADPVGRYLGRFGLTPDVLEFIASEARARMAQARSPRQ